MRRSGTRIHAVLFASLGLALALAAAPAPAENRGTCVRAELPWRVTLPDGTTREAGTLGICLQQMYNPAAGLHEVRFEGSTLGLFTSRATRSEGLYSGRPVVVFQLDRAGEHTLIGYAIPDGDAMRTYVLYETGHRAPDLAIRLDAVAPDTTQVRVAALVD